MTISHYEIAWCAPNGKLHVEKVYRESEIALVVATARLITRSGVVQVLSFDKPSDLTREYEHCRL